MKRRHPAIRFLKHLLSTALPVSWQVHKHFSASALNRIEKAIQQSEQLHAGEIRFVVEACLHPMEILGKKTPKRRALELFGRFNIWDTAQNNGVLIYLLLADRDVEIVADRGIHQYVGNDGWDAICHAMELQFRQGNFEAGVLQGLDEISRLLQKHYPADADKTNELSNKPIIL
ncbi:MAG: TPM domain-containing protein [Pseudomonadota bacterium]